ncbi:MAG: hypothetical protein AB8F74_11585 [Saprospiraceae bacterium]
MENSPTKELQQPKEKFWDASMVVSVLAVLISSMSAFISLKESNIMMQQQQVLAEQQEASVWPYISTFYSHRYTDSTAYFEFSVTNKGVGPAIIDSVQYIYKDSIIESWTLSKVLQKEFPKIKISQIQNASLDGSVLAPGESFKIITEQFSTSKNGFHQVQKILNLLDQDYKIKFCYCSVYGKCWQVDGDQTERSTDCTFREEIR